MFVIRSKVVAPHLQGCDERKAGDIVLVDVDAHSGPVNDDNLGPML